MTTGPVDYEIMDISADKSVSNSARVNSIK